jgi:site-specific DNA-methyltransferase (adenine-specific)
VVDGEDGRLAAPAESYPTRHGLIVRADCFEWLNGLPPGSVHAIVTDPPYGVKEFEPDSLHRLRTGNIGGIWRIPPSYDGHVRAPLPRFTALTRAERSLLQDYFSAWSRAAARVLVPGAHVFIAGNAFLSQIVWSAVVAGGLEFRGELIRLVRTLRGGDRPKNAHAAYPQVCSMPRGAYEPWGIFRAPMPRGMRVSDCLREHGTGGLRRGPDGRPFVDVVMSERTPRAERDIAPHPSLKPQSLLRQLVYAVLPLGTGVIADPFMGTGSTVAAADAMGARAVGVERDAAYFDLARSAIPRLAALTIDGPGRASRLPSGAP